MGIPIADYLLIKARLEKYKVQSNEAYCTSSDPKPESVVCHEPVGTAQGKTSHTTRFLVRITSHRRRLIDPDNLCPKFQIDCLRYAEIIPNDTEKDIEISLRQVKDETDFTEIEVIPI